MKKKPEPGLRVRALRILARREHSRAELFNKLLPHVQDGEDIESVLDELERKNWLSDARAADMIVSQRRSRFGAQRIIHELHQKGIAENLIDHAIPQLRETELEAAREVWKKKFGTLPGNQKEKAQQVRFLQSRGFSVDVIFRVLK